MKLIPIELFRVIQSHTGSYRVKQGLTESKIVNSQTENQGGELVIQCIILILLQSPE